jgi:hypothetical protein
MPAKTAITAKPEPAPVAKKSVSKSKSPAKAKSAPIKAKPAVEESKVAPAKGNLPIEFAYYFLAKTSAAKAQKSTTPAKVKAAPEIPKDGGPSPKKAKTPYIFFVSEETVSLKKAQPDAKPTDLMQLAAKKWSELTDK